MEIMLVKKNDLIRERIQHRISVLDDVLQGMAYLKDDLPNSCLKDMEFLDNHGTDENIRECRVLMVYLRCFFDSMMDFEAYTSKSNELEFDSEGLPN